jgi:hypothetical protein
MIVENLQQLYTDVFNDWIVENEQVAEELPKSFWFRDKTLVSLPPRSAKARYPSN